VLYGALTYRASTLAPKPSPPATSSRRTTGSAMTASTPPASSPSATTAAYTTSDCPSTSAAPTSSCSSTTAKSASSTATPQLIRKLVLDPTRDYQPRGVKCGNSPENRL
jgi:hypothetical protein